MPDALPDLLLLLPSQAGQRKMWKTNCPQRSRPRPLLQPMILRMFQHFPTSQLLLMLQPKSPLHLLPQRQPRPQTNLIAG